MSICTLSLILDAPFGDGRDTKCLFYPTLTLGRGGQLFIPVQDPTQPNMPFFTVVPAAS